MSEHDNELEPPPLPLPEAFYDRAPQHVASDLIGKSLIRRTDDGICGGLIVETEAYLASNDPASHAFRGQTKRNSSMFGPPGSLYVYTIHAKYCCNAVTQQEGIGSAVLIRALEPVWGVRLMQNRRQQEEPLRLCRGPAMLCQALAIDLRHDGASLKDDSVVWIGDRPPKVKLGPIVATSRIGISQAVERQLRFFVRDHPFVSGPKNRHSQGRRVRVQRYKHRVV
ncbi:MAG: DNA-3-methyladenine glycosylase [Pirellulaceae bacterium]